VKRKIQWLFIAMGLMCTTSVAISVYMGIQPGLSTQDDVNKILGQPIKAISATTFEYTLPSSTGKIFIDFRADSPIVNRIERHFLKPISRSALIKSLNLPENAEEKGKTKEGKLIEYFGGVKLLSLNYASGETSSGVISLIYYSMEAFEGGMDKARNPQVQFDPSACRDLYFWAQTERDVAKRSKNVGRHQAILEISILSQRGECEKAQSLAASYKEKYK